MKKRNFVRDYIVVNLVLDLVHGSPLRNFEGHCVGINGRCLAYRDKQLRAISSDNDFIAYRNMLFNAVA